MAWGQKYGIHVSLNLHKAPGYCIHDINDEYEPKDAYSLWKDKEAKDAFVTHWSMFAKRYQNIPSEYLSFDLLNEPRGSSDDGYAAVYELALKGIRQYDPSRQIMEEFEKPREMADKSIILSPHFYEPQQLTFYGSDFTAGAKNWPTPKWPMDAPMSATLYGAYKAGEGLNTKLVFYGDFKADTQVSIKVGTVSILSDFVVAADDTPVYQKTFKPGPGTGEWEQVVYQKEWDIYQNLYNKTYVANVPQASSKLSLYVADGDWLSFNSITISDKDRTVSILPNIYDWGVPAAEYSVDAAGGVRLKGAIKGYQDFETTWQSLAATGTKLHAGEFGVYNKTPETVTLAYLEDRLKFMKAQNIGWALWDFDGAFGIFNSERQDVSYEDYQGYKLDRQMLELLQRY